MKYKTVKVQLDARSYPIYIGNNLLRHTEIWARHIVAEQVMIVSNQQVASYYLPPLQEALQNIACDSVILPDGEQYKNLATLNKIFDRLLEKKHRRNTTLIALGGGVICDMTGFAAACYQRGAAFIQIPTSLLAQVDASIGGKTAVNHALGKNMIGAFYQPRAVIVDIGVLKTLPEREFYAGIAEIIKAALLDDAAFFVWLEQHMEKLLQRDREILITAIEKACIIKAKIVAEDEEERNGRRALLNLGHTFGHAVEQVMGYGNWLHGEAVAVGMVLAAELSCFCGTLQNSEVNRIKKILLAAHLPIHLPKEIAADTMLAAMMIDKKLQNSQLKLVLLKQIGEAELVNVADVDLVKKVIKNAQNF